ncbi:MAG TPA: hypothetical protein PLG60_08315 [Acidimicrobiales bacterium]|nr:hypothetical protein [Acidimicrobiales bacterium]
MNEELTRDESGESACYAHLICPSCQQVLDGSAHREDCRFLSEPHAPAVELTTFDESG